MLTIASAETFSCFNLTVINDSLVELNKLFQVLITSLPGQEGVESGEIKPVEFEPIVQIIDDDGMSCVCNGVKCVRGWVYAFV